MSNKIGVNLIGCGDAVGCGHAMGYGDPMGNGGPWAVAIPRTPAMVATQWVAYVLGVNSATSPHDRSNKRAGKRLRIAEGGVARKYGAGIGLSKLGFERGSMQHTHSTTRGGPRVSMRSDPTERPDLIGTALYPARHLE